MNLSDNELWNVYLPPFKAAVDAASRAGAGCFVKRHSGNGQHAAFRIAPDCRQLCHVAEMIGALDVLLDERICIHYAAPSTSLEQLLPYGIEIARGHVEFVL